MAGIREVDLCAYPVEDGQGEFADEGGESVDQGTPIPREDRVPTD